MKKLILSFFMIAMLTGCVSEPVKKEEVTTTARTIVSKEQKPVVSDENSFSKYYDYINELCYEYEKDIDKNWQDYSSFPLPLYIGMCDVNSDETPEIMLGFLQPREEILYDVYSLKTKEKLFSFCGSIVDNPFCNKMYYDNDGNIYFMSYSSGELHDGKINAEKISFSGGKWNVVSGVENEGYSPDDEYKMIKSASIILTSGEKPLTDEVIADKLSELVAEYEKLPLSDFEKQVMNKKSELDKTDTPFGVYGVFRGTDFDYNSDGTDDYSVAYGLYSQFQFVVFDGKTYDVLLDERIMTQFESENLIIKLYSDNNGNYALVFKNRTQVAAASELTETVQIFKENEKVVFEAVFDKESGEYLHSYDEYDTYEDYVSKQQKCLDGYTYLFELSDSIKKIY